MRKNRLVLILALGAGLLLGACTRSASTDPLGAATQDPLESIFSTVATQTALAAGQKSPPDAALTLEASPSPLFGDTATVAPSTTPSPTASSTPAPITQLAVPSTYVLHEGEWPYCLARRFDIDPDALLAANGLNSSNANNLSVGTQLTIPTGAGKYGGERSLRAHPASYVASGTDTFYSIACLFGDVWPEHIAEANGMQLSQSIPGGTQLHIP